LDAIALILRVGLIAGILDINENLIVNRLCSITADLVLHYIASARVGMRGACAEALRG
jgi:hypothetical protein